MSLYTLENFSFKYPDEEKFALKDVNLSVEKGEFILVCGKSGSGKTTLLKALKLSVAPKGEKSGRIIFNGADAETISRREDAEKISFVGQSPEMSVVTDKVWKELAFTMESLGYDNGAIRMRTGEAAAFFGLQDVFFENIRELSGGQIQLVNIASAMILDPDVIILDEPCARLDPLGAERLFNQLRKINRELGITVIISEHRTDELVSCADRLIFLDEGRIIYDGKPNLILEDSDFEEEILLFPQVMQIFYGAGDSGACPTDVSAGRRWLESKKIFPPEKKDFIDSTEEKIVSLKEVWFKYKEDGPYILKGSDLDVCQGEIYSVLGGNGAGKTTLLSLITGMNKPYRGKAYVKDGLKIGYLPQNPNSIFSEDVIFEDLMLAGGTLEEVLDMAYFCRIEKVMHRNPYDVSGGERERAALAKILLTKPDILVLDEPTQGLDGIFKLELGNLLREIQRQGKTVIIVSHDMDFCAEFSDRCGLFFGGRVLSSQSTKDFFEYNNFYTTQAKKISSGIIERAVTVDDVLSALGRPRKINVKNSNRSDREEIMKRLDFPKETRQRKINGLNFAILLSFIYVINLSQINDFFMDRGLFTHLFEKLPFWNYILGFSVIVALLAITVIRTKNTDYVGVRRKRLMTKTKVLLALLLISVPFTVFIGSMVFVNRAYLAVSALVMAEVILIFLVLFEKRRPQAEFVVMVSFLCAIAVAGRIVFFAVPQFKPIGAVIIITAAAFGGETGFFVGAVSLLVSNMFFGQGPWTPWQMLTFGLMGFVAGSIFEKGLLKPSRLTMMILGGVLTVVIYGGIINPASVIMYNSEPTKSMFIFAYAAGIPFDVIHAASTMFFIWILGESFLKKIERVKKKYELDM